MKNYVDPVGNLDWEKEYIEDAPRLYLDQNGGLIKKLDEVIIYDTEDDLYELLGELKPDIRIIGTDWKTSKSGFTGDDLPIQIYWHQRSHDWSSSELRKRVYNAENDKNE